MPNDDVKEMVERLRKARDAWPNEPHHLPSLLGEAAALLESVHARGLAEGLAEAAKVVEDSVYGVDRYDHGFHIWVMGLAADIRAKIEQED